MNNLCSLTVYFCALLPFQMFENLKNQSVDASWDTSEAALFIMCAVAKNILP